MKIGYARISTRDQSLQLQVDALKEAGCEKIYQEVASGAKTDRPVLNELMAHLRPGDILVIWKLDRLSRITKHLLQIGEDFEKKDIYLISLMDKIDATGAFGKFLFRFLASLSELERDNIVARTKAGLAAARARGIIGGRRSWESMGGPPKEVLAKARVAEILYQDKTLSRSAILKQLGIGKTAYYRYLRLRGVRINEPIQKIVNFRNKNKEAVCG